LHATSSAAKQAKVLRSDGEKPRSLRRGWSPRSGPAYVSATGTSACATRDPGWNGNLAVSAAGDWLGQQRWRRCRLWARGHARGALRARDRGRTSGPRSSAMENLHMGIGALWTAVHYRLPVLIVVNNNVSFVNDEIHQSEVATNRGRPVENSWIGMRMEAPEVDLAQPPAPYALAEGPITDPEKLGPALRRAVEQVARGRVALLDVRTASR